MFGKKLLIFLTLMLNLHIARGLFDFFIPNPLQAIDAVISGKVGEMLYDYYERVEKPVTYATAASGVVVGTVFPDQLASDVSKFGKHPHASSFACGPDNNRLAKHLAEYAVVVTHGCVLKIDAMHECCVKHDSCYLELGKTQAECDKTFCVCIRAATTGTGCAATGESFCNLVTDYGDGAYKEAQEETKAKV
ncbi:hypothetical protein GPALN_002989 [Globodera pallida]|nr:hypothetical protein GPALN_002989 [Globodera pallida]